MQGIGNRSIRDVGVWHHALSKGEIERVAARGLAFLVELDVDQVPFQSTYFVPVRFSVRFRFLLMCAAVLRPTLP